MQTECKETHLVTESTAIEQKKICFPSTTRTRQLTRWITALSIILIAIASCIFLWHRLDESKSKSRKEKLEPQNTSTIQLAANSSALLGIKLYQVRPEHPAYSFRTPGSIEANHKRVQQITPLATGRVSDVLVSTGELVKKGDLLVVVESPQVAELHGKLHEAQSKAQLAKGELYRVKEAANQVNILKAKAKLDEAEATLSRNKQLASEGLLAGKDLIAAESDWKQALAEYEFQKNISLNGEIARAQGVLNTEATEVAHLRDGLRSLDAKVESKVEQEEHDISRMELRAPMAGSVIERFVNPGSGTEIGKPLLTLADTSTLWVIASVPELQLKNVKIGMPVVVSIDGKNKILAGTVSYIDPRINEDTRTARVRIEIENSRSEIAIGSFAEVEFKTNRPSTPPNLLVPESAIQDLNGEKNVFVQTNPGNFKRKRVEIGARFGNMISINSGIKAGDRIATDGSFLLKSALLKDTFGGTD